jgi:putative spermidine/putrescine transport system ATP-binding protein
MTAMAHALTTSAAASSGYLRLNNVVKSYDGRTNAVDGVSLDVARGEFVSFLGPSGSGKTTLLMIIAGFEAATSGSVEVAGRDLTLLPPYRRNIGVVFQSYALFPHMSVAQNVGFPLRMRGRSRDDIKAAVRRSLEIVGLERFSDRQPRELSGGQQQRVALARSFIFDPELVLLDEPLSALDKNLREQMQLEIKRIQRELGITMVYVTHDQSEAITMSDRVAVFNAGKLEQVGPPLDVYHRPATRFVGEFLGDSNVLRVKPLGEAGRGELVGFGPVRIAGLPAEAALGGSREVILRPEKIQLLEAGERRDQWNCMDLTVEDTISYGNSYLILGSAGDVPLRVRASGSAPAWLKPGETARVAWSPDDAHILAGQAK